MMSPKEIITGFRVIFLQHCKLEFGDYVQTHEEHTNDMKLHMIGVWLLLLQSDYWACNRPAMIHHPSDAT